MLPLLTLVTKLVFNFRKLILTFREILFPFLTPFSQEDIPTSFYKFKEDTMFQKNV